MFDVSFPELMVIAVVALLVLGPDRLPTALRTLGLWLGRMRRSFVAIKTEVEREIGMDEVRRQLHNESIMEDLKRIEREVKSPLVPPVTAPTATATPAAAKMEGDALAPAARLEEANKAPAARLEEANKAPAARVEDVHKEAAAANDHDGVPEASRQS